MTTTPEPASTLRQENAGTHDTTVDSFVAPGVTDQLVESDAADQLEVLTTFLDTHFPGEMQRTNRQIPETAVQCATRLLIGLSAQVPPGSVSRCEEAYCNKTRGHLDAHGWVHHQ